MELELDERGLLTPGIHDVSLDDVKEKFGRFQKTDRRPTLFAKLCEYLDAVKRADCGQSVIIDGSFVMACVDEPEDIDVLVVLPPDWDDAADLRPYQYNPLSKRIVKRTFGLDAFVVAPGSADEAEWIRFFCFVGPKWREKFGLPDEIRKGILRVPI